MVKFKQVYREIYEIALCVTGLDMILIGLNVIIDKFSITFLMSLLIGSLSSLINHIIYRIETMTAKKPNCNRKSQLFLVMRLLLMIGFTYLLLTVPFFNGMLGITAIFFVPVIRLYKNVIIKMVHK